MSRWEPRSETYRWPVPLHIEAWHRWSRNVEVVRGAASVLLVQGATQGALWASGNGHPAVAGVFALGAACALLLTLRWGKVRRWLWDRSVRRSLRRYGPDHLPSHLLLDPELERAGLGERVAALGPEGAEIARALAAEHDGTVGDLLELAALLGVTPEQER